MSEYTIIGQYTTINRSLILEWDKLKDVKLCEFKQENEKEYTPSVKIKLYDVWITILCHSKDESYQLERELRKIIMKSQT